MNKILSYLNFFWKSKNEHGVHSPFVFDLVTKCFYDKTVYSEYSLLSAYRKSLFDNKKTIVANDFIMGSKIFNSNTRQKTKIVKTVEISFKKAKLLFRIVKYYQPKNILEIGASLGLATSALSLGNKNGTITSLEAYPSTIKIVQNHPQNLKLNNIELVNSNLLDYLNNLKSKFSTINFDLIYFKNTYSQTETLKYFEQLLPTTTNDTVWIFNDIHCNKNMEQAWEIIKIHPKVSVSIDTFQLGIVFFRTQQAKEHFVIRI